MQLKLKSFFPLMFITFSIGCGGGGGGSAAPYAQQASGSNEGATPVEEETPVEVDNTPVFVLSSNYSDMVN